RERARFSKDILKPSKSPRIACSLLRDPPPVPPPPPPMMTALTYCSPPQELRHHRHLLRLGLLLHGRRRDRSTHLPRSMSWREQRRRRRCSSRTPCHRRRRRRRPPRRDRKLPRSLLRSPWE
ncbi:unnamed protein product, partial [Musa acuminata subsp. malaccensis]